MRFHPVLLLLLLPCLPGCDDSSESVAAAEPPEAYLEGVIGDLRGAARQHQELLDRVGLPLLPSDPECDALVADFRAVLEPAMLPGVIEDWNDLTVRMGLVSLFYQLCPEGEVQFGPPREVGGGDDGAGAVRIRVEYPSAAGDPERQDLVLAPVYEGWRLCRRPVQADHPEEEVALALGMGLLPCSDDAPETLRATLAALVDARPRVSLLERREDGPSLRLRLRVEADPLDGPLEFTAVHELAGWTAHP